MNRIDFHVLIHPTQDRSDSLHDVYQQFRTLDCANLFVVRGIDGHIGRGRNIGFRKGHEKYCSFVDDDDKIEPAVLGDCIAILDAASEVDAIVTAEIIYDDFAYRDANCPVKNGDFYDLSTATHIHPLVIFKRKSIAPFLEKLNAWPNWCEFSLIISMIKAGLKFMHYGEVGYYWHQHNKGASSLMNILPSLDSINLVRESMNTASMTGEEYRKVEALHLKNQERTQ